MGVKKVGHCGTLDPAATGLLILCVGKATKMVDSFTGMEKCYTGSMKLGVGTHSQDADTEPDETLPWEHITDGELTEGAAGMVGELAQVPPMYSAIKVKGGGGEISNEALPPPRSPAVKSPPATALIICLFQRSLLRTNV